MTSEQVCYYGLRVGCPNATNPNCQLCAERLTHAVNQVLRSGTASDAEANRSAGALIDDGSAGASIDDGSTEHISDLRSTVLSYARERS
ncbi:MAG: hypothetical protein ACXV2B_04625 [Halobacteriota archaeon]